MKRVLIIASIFLIPLTPVVLVVTGVLKSSPKTVPAVTLTVWGTDEDEAGLTALIKKYRQTRSYVTLVYTKVKAEEYAQQLISAWAQGTGPDIFFTPSTWIGKMSQYAVPMPGDLTVPQVVFTKGVIGTSSKVVSNVRIAPTINALKNSYADAVTGDIIQDEQVWGMPLNLDTIVTFYNKDLTNNAKIFEPAVTWSQLQTQLTANKLTQTDEQGKLVRSGVALGTSTNVPYAAEILGLLMLQNGSTMVAGNKVAQINDDAGLQALKFYLSFAQPQKNNYSWDAAQTNARDAFLQGRLAYFFGTLADRSVIAATNLNWGVAPMLHIRPSGDNDGTTSERYIDAARFNVAMVSKSSAQAGRSTQAWNFIENITQPANVKPYLLLTNTLPAQKSLLAEYENNQDLSVFAKQLLTAKTWYHGRDGVAVTTYLNQLIDAGLTEKVNVLELLNRANAQIQSTL